MRLDVVIPTYNRTELLKRTLDSLLAARVPDRLEVRIAIVDNNSLDDTRQVVESYIEKFAGRVSYLFESKQGRSHAINKGITSTGGDLVGFLDDDEEIDVSWYERVYSAFKEDDVDFIGGACVPRWGATQPRWLPSDYRGVIGWVDGGDSVRVYGENYDGILMGGNAVIKRSILEKVGLYTTSLGRTDKHLLSCEDEDMMHRLLAAGAHGLYLPDLIIYHYIPPERLTKSYHRRWCFWRGVSLGLIDRERRAPVTYLLGMPRYLYGHTARSLLRIARRPVSKSKDPSRYFSDELAVWDFLGFFYGKHLYRPARPRQQSVEDNLSCPKLT